MWINSDYNSSAGLYIGFSYQSIRISTFEGLMKAVCFFSNSPIVYSGTHQGVWQHPLHPYFPWPCIQMLNKELLYCTKGLFRVHFSHLKLLKSQKPVKRMFIKTFYLPQTIIDINAFRSLRQRVTL